MEKKWEQVESEKGFGWNKMQWSPGGPHLGFPLILLVIGIYWLGSDMGIWPVPFSIWPVLLIALASYWLIKGIIYK
ncbi:hypothetical protein KKG83_02595 [Candidatus Micrarchaeota archaeon]|nr:hypothetical protein [Candidatus Micrarchaeota archaeon]